MLMRYAQHLAAGHGIVWNIGQPPVDGATDFLFMVLVAAIHALGASLEGAVRGLCLGAHVLTVLVVYLAIRAAHGAPRWMGLVSALFFAIGPGLKLTEAYFGTPVFALFSAVCWALAATAINRPDPPRWVAPAFAWSGLVLGLIRPEGVFLAAFMLLAVLVGNGWRTSRRTVIWFAGVFAVAGGAYFIWRWSYFGYPLPNPYYKKGGGHLHIDGLHAAVRNLILYTIPFFPVFVLGLTSRRSLRAALLPTIPIALFTALWILLSNEMNYMGRFQYPVVPIPLIAWPGILLAWLPAQREVPIVRRIGFAPIAAILTLVAVWGTAIYLTPDVAWKPVNEDGRYEVALKLRELKHSGDTIVVTEAGLVPFYSEWNAVDAWGLNDKFIAHNEGHVTEGYLDSVRPQAMLIHVADDSDFSNPWTAMVHTLRKYAVDHHFRLVGSFGPDEHNLHEYWVSPDFAGADEFARFLDRLHYRWYLTGEVLPNRVTATSDHQPG